MAPVFARLAKHYRKRVEFIAVNAVDRPDIAKRFGVRSTPTFVLMRRGKSIRHFYGNVPEQAISKQIDPWAPKVEIEEEEEDNSGFLSRLFKFGRSN